MQVIQEKEEHQLKGKATEKAGLMANKEKVLRGGEQRRGIETGGGGRQGSSKKVAGEYMKDEANDDEREEERGAGKRGGSGVVIQNWMGWVEINRRK